MENHVADSGVTQAVGRSSFTRGPWHHGSPTHGDRKHMVFAEGRAVCVCEPDYRARPSADEYGQQISNARLCAAAPTLLDALVTFIEGSWESETQGGVVVPAWIFDRCADAIKLAVEERGGSK